MSQKIEVHYCRCQDKENGTLPSPNRGMLCGKPATHSRYAGGHRGTVYECEEHYQKYAQKEKERSAKRRQNPEYVQNINRLNKKRYQERKGTTDARYKSLTDVSAKEQVKLLIEKEDFEIHLKTSVCYLTGIKISEHLSKTSLAYYLDRIGKKEHGGNGIGGGDYCWDNVLPCVFNANQAREALGFTTDEMKLLFLPYRTVTKVKRFFGKCKYWVKKIIIG